MKPAIVFVILQTGALANGGLQSIGEVMRRLKDHRPIVLTNLESEWTEAWRGHGIEVHVVPEEASGGFRRKPAGTVRTYRRYHRALRRILAASRARIVHANDPLSFQLALAAAKRAKARIVLNLRDTLDPERRPPRLKFRAIFAAADHVLYLSKDMSERWRTVAGNATRASSVTYSIVDPDRFSPAPAAADATPIVLVPGIFWPKKGQLDFIRNVVPALAKRGIESWFAGDFEPDANPYAAACAEAARPHSDSVRFLGYRRDLPELFAEASAIAIPSRHEGLMRGMIEAMGCGRPVVSLDVCSAREVLEDTGAGVVVGHGDFAGMAAALIRYATDPDARAAAGLAGRAAARRMFDPDEVVERYERVYRALGRA
ncbi:MAG TPA: glycosyltransferase family 4 protein [Sphingomicrobium sp.]